MIYTQEVLEKCGIFELRTIARQVGVKSPTTKIKHQNIEEILKIQSGQMPVYRPKKVGRPTKFNETRLAEVHKLICEKKLQLNFSINNFYNFLVKNKIILIEFIDQLKLLYKNID